MKNPSPHILLSVNTTWNVYNFRSGLIRRLIQEGCRVTVATPKGTGDESRIAELGCRHLQVDLVGRSKNLFREIKGFFQYWNILKNEAPDCVLLFTIKPNLYMGLICKFLKIPYINNITGLGFVFLNEDFLSRSIRRLYKKALSASSKVFFQNRDDQALFLSQGLVDESVVGLLPGSGVNLEKFYFSPKNYDQDVVRPFKFILAARLLWSKGVGEYVQAAKILKDKGYQVEFLLLGFCDEKDREVVGYQLINQWSLEGLVINLEYTEDVYLHLAASDCVVLPSYREGTPKVLLEAMAVGRPIITTNVPGCREVLDPGKNGYFCAPKSSESLAEAMEKMLNLPPSRLIEMGAYARRKAEQKFSEDFVAEAYLSAIQFAYYN